MSSASSVTNRPAPRPKADRINWGKYAFIFVGVSFLGVLVLLPVGYMFRYASSTGLGVFWENISSPEALFSLRFTIALAAATTVINGIIGREII